MKNLNQELQANYQIISLLEKSKTNSETILDRLPDMFFILESNGNILKANHQSAKWFNLSEEALLGLNISRLFLEETWRLFNIHLKQASFLTPNDKPIEFELPVDGKSGVDKIAYWTIAPLSGFTSSDSKLYCLIGRDITLLRAYQKQLAEIFASIPLGIMTVDRAGKVDDAYSTYTHWLLGTDQIKGRNINELLYQPCEEFMDSISREGWNNLKNFSNLSPKEFDMLSETFPTQFYYPLSGKDKDSGTGRYLGMKVQSIVHGQKVNGILIILEDRTLLVEAEQADEKKRLLQDLALERAIQIKQCDPDLLEVVLSDLSSHFSQLGDAMFMKNKPEFEALLHTIKGNSRLGGFSILMKKSHALETKIKTLDQKEFEWNKIFIDVDDLRSEWREISSLAKILVQKSDDTEKLNQQSELSINKETKKSIYQLVSEFITLGSKASKELKNQLLATAAEVSYKPIQSMEGPIRSWAQSTAQSTGKKVKVVFDWDHELKIDETYLSDYRACIMHLLTNAIDHGIESPEKRLEKRKSIHGTIKIAAYQAGSRFVATIDDDGAGLNFQKIKLKALENKIVTKDSLDKMSDNEIAQLIFSPGFSTADTISEYSGRGVGLAAVADVARKWKGDILVSTSKLGGTHFQFYFSIESR